MNMEDDFLLKSMVDFLSRYSWLYNFSNVKVFSHFDSQQIPVEWVKFMTSCSTSTLKDILLCKEDSEGLFPFVYEFVKERNDLVAKFEEHIGKSNIACHNSFPTRGMSLKKIHEVKSFCNFLSTHINLENESKKTDPNDTREKLQHTDLIVDCGSGAGHLERGLVLGHGIEPSKIICIECSSAHVESSKRLMENTYDGQDKLHTIVETLNDSNESSDRILRNIETNLQIRPNSMALIGLHSCGDLTNTMLSWFVKSKINTSLAVLSCCYHKMQNFPLSKSVQHFATIPLKSHFALRLACQEPLSAWIEQSEEQHLDHCQTFGRRAILEKVCHNLNVTPRKKNRHGIRQSSSLSKEQYAERVIETFDFDGSCSPEEVKDQFLKEDFNNFGILENLTGLQAFLQIVLEYIVLIDKVKFLEEHGLKASLYELFDEKLSPRNILLWCQK